MVCRIGHAARAVAVAAGCSVALASVADAATLRVAVTPATIHKGGSYQIKIAGRYRKSELSGRAYLIAVIQFTTQPCKTSAQLENAEVKSSLLEFYFRPSRNSQTVGIYPGSPFTRKDSFSAKSTSSRRVCAYLYPRFISASDSIRPIARASARYTVIK